MDTIAMMLTGKVEMKDFIVQLKSDKGLQNQVRSLVPNDARYNPDHMIWRRISYDTLKKCNFDLLSVLDRICKFDGRISDNLNIFGTIRAVYVFCHPDTNSTEKYDKAFCLYLTVIKDCYDGPEVQHIVERIIQEALTLKTKKKQMEQARQEIVAHFPLAGKKPPRWIQGPEWPMGLDAPMMFVSQKREGEAVCYIFKDVVTGKVRKVEQWY